MSKIEIDFNNLKYNLYEILNVNKDDSEIIIKKKFIKIIKNFHPDKNSELEEDIYYHIILAHQILIDKESKEKYDNYITNKELTFIELKESYNKKSISVNNKNNFNQLESELNMKHGYNNVIDEETIIDKFNRLKKTNNDIIIPKENYKSNDEFNSSFNNKNNMSIIEYNEPSELTNYISGEIYTYINDINKLYIEDSIESFKYTSLDKAFNTLPNFTKIKLDNRSSKEKIKDYNNLSELLYKK